MSSERPTRANDDATQSTSFAFSAFPTTWTQAGRREVSLRGPRILVAVLAFAGCATTDTFWAKPELTPATKADMSRYGQDAYDCVRESKQTLGSGELQSSVQHNAQRWYVLCMKARGYEVREGDATR
jgi:hypothetical protein